MENLPEKAFRTLRGDEPHPGYGGWKRFLLEHCELRDEAEGVRYYGATNCNYLVFPNGLILKNFGVNGRVVMDEVRLMGARAVYRVNVSFWNEISKILCLPEFVDDLHEDRQALSEPGLLAVDQAVSPQGAD